MLADSIAQEVRVAVASGDAFVIIIAVALGIVASMHLTIIIEHHRHSAVFGTSREVAVVTIPVALDGPAVRVVANVIVQQVGVALAARFEWIGPHEDLKSL